MKHTTGHIQKMYEKYLDILHTEMREFGCEPTELRHLIGRLGEFYCALHVQGYLAHETNQHGFDVISSDGRKISVKTTAQISGFVSINPKTLSKVDDLMVLQFIDGELHLLYFGPVEKASLACRKWGNKLELDLTKAKKLNHAA
ncbi:MAG: hypothetical protein AB7I27_19125 [Bacteriovoracaceae bacterium]